MRSVRSGARTADRRAPEPSGAAHLQAMSAPRDDVDPPAHPVRPPMPRRTTPARHGMAPEPATPASVGRRLGRWRWPVVVVVLLVLLLLGALAANRLTGAWAPGTPLHPVAGQDVRVRIVTHGADRWME